MNPVEYTGREKRITFQLYNYWCGLTDNGNIPPLKALSPKDIAPYKNSMVLIDLRDPDNEPTLQVVGQLLTEGLDLDMSLKGISEIPRRSLLSRITDHYMEVLGNRSPVSFDAEFNNRDKKKILYRGILLPFSDNGENINFILGAIRWITEEEKQGAGEPEIPQQPQDDNLLQDNLDRCRTLVRGQNPADNRSRKSLYETLGAILDFHELCLSDPPGTRALLKAEGLKAQKRAPFTPTLKLCFGRDYDKTRLTEYASALSFARKNGQNGAGLPDFLDHYPGGIKGCVRAERESHATPSDKPVKKPLQETLKTIGNMTAIARFEVGEDGAGDDKLCLLLGRRAGPDIEIIKILKEDEKLLNSLIMQMTKRT